MTDSAQRYPQHLTGIPYANEHRLQTLDICLPRPLRASDPKETVWVVFIHGGAWRDPGQTSEELKPALDQILSRSASKETLDRIAGFASLNYGLSTNSPESQEGRDDPALCVKHPTHILDIFKALAFLGNRYSVGGIDVSGQEISLRKDQYNWIAIGHSCGATLAFQICMADAKTWISSSINSATPALFPHKIKPPVAVIGLEGIYSLPLLHQNHKEEPFYDFFMASAFGPNGAMWAEVSPAYGRYERAFVDGGIELVILGHSQEDELVEVEQTTLMGSKLEEQGWNLGSEDGDGSEDIKTLAKRFRGLVVLNLRGKHDEVWSEGNGVRTGIEVAIKRIFKP